MLNLNLLFSLNCINLLILIFKIFFLEFNQILCINIQIFQKFVQMLSTF